jgi:hypothetical protein
MRRLDEIASAAAAMSGPSGNHLAVNAAKGAPAVAPIDRRRLQRLRASPRKPPSAVDEIHVTRLGAPSAAPAQTKTTPHNVGAYSGRAKLTPPTPANARAIASNRKIANPRASIAMRRQPARRGGCVAGKEAEQSAAGGRQAPGWVPESAKSDRAVEPNGRESPDRRGHEKRKAHNFRTP